jgi:hypothetical protein
MAPKHRGVNKRRLRFIIYFVTRVTGRLNPLIEKVLYL